MKIVVFAGGVGTRLWPLSRKNSPKQFEKLFGDKSTLQQTIERLQPEFATKDIYIATGKRYRSLLTQQLPEIPKENFIFEPEMRDVGPAIGLVNFILHKQSPDEPIAILWSDHLIRNVELFKEALLTAEKMIKEQKTSFVFIAQEPRFANQNMGWIEIEDRQSSEQKASIPQALSLYGFKSLRYRPSLEEAQEFMEGKKFVWNLGYFVTTPKFLLSQYKEFAPKMAEQLTTVAATYKTPEFESTLEHVYPQIEKVTFDDVILQKMDAAKALVIYGDFGWSDIGAWESLKEALATNPEENVIKGNVIIQDCRDSLVYNESHQLLVGIDLDEMLVINTPDVTLICSKKSVPKIKKLVESLSGTEHEHLT